MVALAANASAAAAGDAAFDFAAATANAIAASAMEGIGFVAALARAANLTGRAIPYAIVRGASDYNHEPVVRAANGTWVAGAEVQAPVSTGQGALLRMRLRHVHQMLHCRETKHMQWLSAHGRIGGAHAADGQHVHSRCLDFGLVVTGAVFSGAFAVLHTDSAPRQAGRRARCTP